MPINVGLSDSSKPDSTMYFYVFGEDSNGCSGRLSFSKYRVFIRFMHQRLCPNSDLMRFYMLGFLAFLKILILNY